MAERRIPNWTHRAGDWACREFSTRVCPRQLDTGCPDEVCYRFDTFPAAEDDRVREIWEEHFEITDQEGRKPAWRS